MADPLAAPAALPQAPPAAFPEGSPVPAQLAVWSQVLGLIVRLHDREAHADLIAGLRAAGLSDLFATLLPSDEGAEVAAAFAAMLDQLPAWPDDACLDELAAEYADIYLNHGFRTSPSGSVWLTEDHIERQQPMFDVREWYDYYGISVPNWRLRSDDHVVHELQFVQHLLAMASPAAAYDAARFLDRHVLPWVPDFCTQVAQRTREPFHAVACLLTRAVLMELRDVLADLTGLPQEVIPHAWIREAERDRRAAEAAEQDRPFVPGLAESW